MPIVGGIPHLPLMLERHPEAPLVVYNRVSSYAQAGRGKKNLHAKTAAVVKDVKRLAPGRKVLRTFDGVEEGYLHKPRKKLMEALRYAKEHGAILVAADQSRFVRPLSYSRTKNRNAWPRSEDYARLREIAPDVVLATAASPDLTEDQRHSLATRRAGTAGRPRAFNHEREIQVFRAVECIRVSEDGRQKWEPSMRRLAKMFKVSLSTIHRLPGMRSPWGPTWNEILSSVEPHDYQPTERSVVWLVYFPAEAIREWERQSDSGRLRTTP